MVPQTHIQLNWYISHFYNMHAIQDSFAMQGELEHHMSKVQFARTSRKAYVSQLASIEQRQACIHRIHLKRDALNIADPMPNKAEQHHIIGESQNFPEDLTSFMQTNMGDPTIQVSAYNSYGWIPMLIRAKYAFSILF